MVHIFLLIAIKQFIPPNHQKQSIPKLTDRGNFAKSKEKILSGGFQITYLSSLPNTMSSTKILLESSVGNIDIEFIATL